MMKLNDSLYGKLTYWIDNRIFPIALSIVLLIVVFKLLRLPVALGLVLVYDMLGYGIFSPAPGANFVALLILLPLSAYISYWLLVGSMYVYDKF